MVVAGEHQVDPPIAGPVEQVGRVAQQDAEIGGGTRDAVDRTAPRGRTSRRSRSSPVDFEVVQRPSSVSKPARPSSRTIASRLVFLVVVAQDRELAQPGLERPEERLDPANRSSCSTRSPVRTIRSACQ